MGFGNWCCAVGCTNSAGGNSSVSFHRFPGDGALRKQWIQAVRRDKWSPTSTTRLCSEHFHVDCYEASSLLKLEFGLSHGTRKLKPDAVPTLFKHTEPRRPPIERGALAKRKRSELVQDALDAAAAGPSQQEAAPDPAMDDDSECFFEQTSESASADVGCQANIHLATRKKKTQTSTQSRSVGNSSYFYDIFRGDMDEADTAVIWDSDMQDSKDSEYCPEERDMHDSDEEIPASSESEQPDPNRVHEAKFLVFESNLRELLDRCLVCGSPHCKVELSFVGTMCVQKSQYFKFQRCYLLPAVTEVWLFEQAALLDRLRGTKLCLAGDGRADTPGHCADFGTYTLLETTTGQVIHTELVKSTEVSSSNRMETEGMERCLDYLRAQDMSVDSLVTDRHSEGKASMRRNHPEIKHQFDVWHVAKGIKKKIVAVARTKQHSVLLKWMKTIVRHLHWCARTSNGDGKLVMAKWTSLIRHIIDVHQHLDPLHPRCEHGDVPDRLWLEEGTETFKKLEAILMGPHLLRDIPLLSPKQQTFSLESFHAVLIHFAPKSSKFQYDGMLARTYIAALHFNHNADRAILLDEDGMPKFFQQCSKAEKRWTLVPAKEKVTFDYVQKLTDALLECVIRWPTYAIASEAAYRVSHDTLSSKCGVKPPMEDAVAMHRSRFST
ncbi:uncharacterized protein ISCGN_013946 [Ixodes scapularis]